MTSANYWTIAIFAILALVLFTVVFMASRYKRCPSDRILVIYGKVKGGKSSRTLHGGGAFVWPLIQDYAYLSLTPMTINIPLENALSLQNIRIHVPSTFTVGVSTSPEIMTNAAERLLRLDNVIIEDMSKEIIFGQLRLTVASLTIEQINQDRESFLVSVRQNVEPELNKIGLHLINVNITDITDESDYIESIGKKAASEALNKAKVDVAEQVKIGDIGEAEANREKEIKVSEAVAESEKGQKKAEAGQRIYIQGQEADAVQGENAAKANIANHNAELEVKVSEASAESEKGRKKAEAGQRVFVQEQEAEAIQGENTAKANIAVFNAELKVKEAEALQKSSVARLEAEAEIQKAQYEAEQERLRAAEVVREEIEKDKIEIAAEAQAEKTRRVARGEADGILMRFEAEAEGIQKLLEAKATGYASLVDSVDGDAKAAATLLLVEKLEEIVEMQVAAISNLKIDKITVWDSGGNGEGGSSTANFISGLFKSLPPLQDISTMAGLELPDYLGNVIEEGAKNLPSGKKTVTKSDPEPKTPKAKAEPKTKAAPKTIKKPKDE